MEQKTVKKKTFTGRVASDGMDKTVIVEVTRYVKHPKYRKYHKITKRYKAHDENNEYRVGDTVRIEECRPLSRDKSYTVIGRTREGRTDN